MYVVKCEECGEWEFECDGHDEEMFVNGTYELIKSSRIIIGVTSAEYKKGHKVSVNQYDKERRKLLVDFGGRDIDWISIFKFEKMFNLVK